MSNFDPKILFLMMFDDDEKPRKLLKVSISIVGQRSLLLFDASESTTDTLKEGNEEAAPITCI